MDFKLLGSLILGFAFSLTAQAAPNCYTGEFSVALGAIHLKYEITNTKLHVEVTNPDEPVTLNNGVIKPARVAFDPGPDMKLIPMKGVRCPCVALQTEKGNFTFVVEQSGDGSEIATIDYFGYFNGKVPVQRCAPKQKRK